jgi:lysyl-tRNA synthetase class 2
MLDKSYLIKRHQLIKSIRSFFDTQGLLEVQTPSLLNSPTTDVYIDSISSTINTDIEAKTIKYLHTSPELEMKKLLSNGSGDIYQICQVFRDNEYGERNFNEFTMLEYYRTGFDIHDLMNDIVGLLSVVGIKQEFVKLSYAQAFNTYGNIDILNTDFIELKKISVGLGISANFEWVEDLQMLLFAHLIEPKLKNMPICFVYDYPEEQCALAKTDMGIAHRFELYINGIEVANGYDELQDADIYRQRFTRENNKRAELSKKYNEPDIDFIEQIRDRIPQCSGVAIGIDRLLHQLL